MNLRPDVKCMFVMKEICLFLLVHKVHDWLDEELDDKGVDFAFEYFDG